MRPALVYAAQHALSPYTTTLAVYILARGFAGLDGLIWVGAIMTIYPVFFAVMENDLKKVLAYSSNNQIGFMVCAVGMGTTLSLNGAAAHAFAHIIFKGLLFMCMGAVQLRLGVSLGGLDLGPLQGISARKTHVFRFLRHGLELVG